MIGETIKTLKKRWPSSVGMAFYCVLFLILDSDVVSSFQGMTTMHQRKSGTVSFTPKPLAVQYNKQRSNSIKLYSSIKDKTEKITTTHTSDIATPAKSALTEETSEETYTNALEKTLGVFVFSALAGLGIWKMYGPIPGQEFFAGYLVEQSLSVDNLLVFLLLFDYFKVPLAYQNRVLNWGIVGAVTMRAIMIGLGAAALEQVHAILLVFAAILVYSSGTVLLPLLSGAEEEEEEEDLSDNWIVKFSKSVLPTSEHYDEDKFFTVENGMRVCTPLFLCMVAVELSDVVFAVDSIPAVFGITANPLIVFSSNMCAILGLRSLYTVLSKAAQDLKYLEPSVAIVLGFIGAKMIAEYFGAHIPTFASLGVVSSFLAGGIWLSLRENAELEREQME